MSAGVILIICEVADYCSSCNRHQDKTMPEAVFLFCTGDLRKKLSMGLNGSTIPKLLQQAIKRTM
jgi:hypothetical protein